MHAPVYVAHIDDALAQLALKYLASLGARTSVVSGFQEDLPDDSIALYTDESISGSHFKLTELGDCIRYKWKIPHWAFGIEKLVALPADDPQTIQKSFYDSVRRIHALVPEWDGRALSAAEIVANADSNPREIAFA